MKTLYRTCLKNIGMFFKFVRKKFKILPDKFREIPMFFVSLRKAKNFVKELYVQYRTFILPACLMMLLCSCEYTQQMVPDNFQSKMSVTSPIERHFAPQGAYAVSYFEQASSDKRLKKFEVWYPAELTGSGKSYPLVVMANGTGVQASRYAPIFRHLASWGFIVIGTEEASSGKGAGCAAALDFMLRQNRLQGSLFKNHVDTLSIGLAGHFQGGTAVFNAATKFRNSHYYKALFAESPAHRELAASIILRCPYDPSDIKVPVMMTASANPNGGDAKNGKNYGICPLISMQETMQTIRRSHRVPVAIARRGDKVNHGENLYESEPYLAAWFCYWLKNDATAAKAFTGGAEIKSNPRWQDVETEGF